MWQVMKSRSYIRDSTDLLCIHKLQYQIKHKINKSTNRIRMSVDQFNKHNHQHHSTQCKWHMHHAFILCWLTCNWWATWACYRLQLIWTYQTNPSTPSSFFWPKITQKQSATKKVLYVTLQASKCRQNFKKSRCSKFWSSNFTSKQYLNTCQNINSTAVKCNTTKQ